jgi:hypothetical protein
MLRLIHNQTVAGPILVDDIDDGLPNKEAHRLGSTADPKAYARDGYANQPKQPCYIARTRAGFPTLPGYIDLNQTMRVTFSAGKGRIKKMNLAGLISVVSLTSSQLVTSTVATAVLNSPGAGDLTITGTTFLSIQPDITTVFITGTGAVTLTAAQIIAGGGTVSATSIVILAASIPGIAAATSFVRIQANEKQSNQVAVS